MIYTFTPDIFFSDEEVSHQSLNKIWINSNERHFLYIDKELYDSILKSEWYSRLRQSNKEFIDFSFNESLNINRKNINVLISLKGKNLYSLTEAVEILTNPVSIILENIEYDSYFIDALLKNFREESKKINSHFKKGWINYENGGGNNIINVINIKKRRFDLNKEVFPKDYKVYSRTLVIIDSDKKYPIEQEIADEKKSLLDFIKQHSQYHVTSKREMENYLPDETLLEIKENEEFISSLLSLSSLQRDYIDIENGLSNINIEQYLPEEYKTLYIDLLSKENKNTHNILKQKKMVLKDSAGKKVNFKANFPKYFLAKSITRETLVARANSDELEIIIKKIHDLL